MKKRNVDEQVQGRIQDFKLGEGAVKKIAPSGGRREIFWGISCEKSRFYAKKSYFLQFQGARPTHWIRPWSGWLLFNSKWAIFRYIIQGLWEGCSVGTSVRGNQEGARESL